MPETRLPSRAEAYSLLREYVTSASLVHHCEAVEAAMRAYARKHGEDEEKWGTVGLAGLMFAAGIFYLVKG